tara:strand:+ start:84 stop:899 length:816 start_codon:yes stop_codon:yes gene_type:complete
MTSSQAILESNSIYIWNKLYIYIDYKTIVYISSVCKSWKHNSNTHNPNISALHKLFKKKIPNTIRDPVKYLQKMKINKIMTLHFLIKNFNNFNYNIQAEIKKISKDYEYSLFTKDLNIYQSMPKSVWIHYLLAKKESYCSCYKQNICYKCFIDCFIEICDQIHASQKYNQSTIPKSSFMKLEYIIEKYNHHNSIKPTLKEIKKMNINSLNSSSAVYNYNQNIYVCSQNVTLRPYYHSPSTNINPNYHSPSSNIYYIDNDETPEIYIDYNDI